MVIKLLLIKVHRLRNSFGYKLNNFNNVVSREHPCGGRGALKQIVVDSESERGGQERGLYVRVQVRRKADLDITFGTPDDLANLY